MLRVLQGSKRSIAAACPLLASTYSARQVARRLQRARLALGSGSQRVDVCDYCHKYDTYVRPKVASLLQDSFNEIIKHDPSFFTAWLEFKETHSRWNALGFDTVASPAYLAAFLEYIKTHGFHSVVNEIVTVSVFFAAAVEGEAGWLECVKGYSAHWQLRDQQQKAFKHDLENPEEGTVYFHMDMADRSRGARCFAIWRAGVVNSKTLASKCFGAITQNQTGGTQIRAP